eukprot:5280218-Pyramimonas_sp.AAC.1
MAAFACAPPARATIRGPIGNFTEGLSGGVRVRFRHSIHHSASLPIGSSTEGPGGGVCMRPPHPG